jgi:hypothetical protein
LADWLSAVQRTLFHQDDCGHRDQRESQGRDEHPAEHFGDVEARGCDAVISMPTPTRSA